jgi:hypothetical protein
MLLPVLLLAMLVAACGGGPGASTDGNGGNGGEESQGAEATATPESEESQDDGGNGGNGGDVDAVADGLVPPNSTELSRTTAGGAVVVGYESTDSPESLQGFYEDAIADTGMEVFSTTSAGGAFGWVFAESEGSSFGGSVTVAPSNTNTGGSTVVITVAAGS